MDKAKLAQLRSVIVNVGDALVITSLGADTGAFTVCFSSSWCFSDVGFRDAQVGAPCLHTIVHLFHFLTSTDRFGWNNRLNMDTPRETRKQTIKAKSAKRKNKKHKSQKLFRRKSLKSLGNFMSRIVKTLGTLAHLGDADQPDAAEDDDGGFGYTLSAHNSGNHRESSVRKTAAPSSSYGSVKERLSWCYGEKTPGVQGLKNHGNTCSWTPWCSAWVTRNFWQSIWVWSSINVNSMSGGSTGWWRMRRSGGRWRRSWHRLWGRSGRSITRLSCQWNLRWVSINLQNGVTNAPFKQSV